MKIRQTTLVVVTVLHLIATSAIGLFHGHDCLLGESNGGTTNVLSSGEHCLACMFTAGFNSTEVDHGSTLVSVEKLFICQSPPYLTFVDHREWSYSILLRGPPLSSTS